MATVGDRQVTLVVMVKDDHVRLRRCLESCRHVTAAQLVLMDREAPAETRDIAYGHASRVIEYDWPGAFDMAINTILPYVETLWTLRLDSDEWIDAGALGLLSVAALNDEAFAWRLLCRNIYTDGSLSVSRQLRLWRTHQGMRYVGSVHEYFAPGSVQAAAGHRRVLDSDVWFCHDGYGDSEADLKMRRNVDLIRDELSQRPGQMRYEVLLGTTLHRLGEYEGMAMLRLIAQRMLEPGAEQPWPRCCVPVIEYVLDGMAAGELYSKLANGLVGQAPKHFPRSPAVLWSTSLAQARRGNLESAIRLLQSLDQVSTAGTWDDFAYFDPRLLGERLWERLADFCRCAGLSDEARTYRARLRAARRGP